jgi:acetylornithine deacetylase
MTDTPSENLLASLLAFQSITRQSNLDLIDHVRQLLEASGISCTIVPDETGSKANLFASVGPADRPGVLLSGHTDVVPVAGQAWTVPPFAMTRREGRLYGRGSADMKGFVACAVQAMIQASQQSLTRPLQLALSYDEEIGCIGVRRLLDVLETAPVQPFVCVVGEPTLMRVATGHKGKTALRAVCHGQESHSALAPLAVNALHLGFDLAQRIRAIQARVAEQGQRDDAYDVPYSTLHIGKFGGGTVLNIVPNRCEFDFEIRNLAEDNPTAWIDELREAADQLSAPARKLSAQAAVEIDVVNQYPGLDTPVTSQAVAFIESFSPRAGERIKVAFGTEGGLFTRRLEVPVVVCGPGSIDVAHKPDEYVEAHQLALCDQFLNRLIASLQT